MKIIKWFKSLFKMNVRIGIYIDGKKIAETTIKKSVKLTESTLTKCNKVVLEFNKVNEK